jgi:hypothetical protein
METENTLECIKISEMNRVLDSQNLELFKYGGHPMKEKLLQTSTTHSVISKYQKI